MPGSFRTGLSSGKLARRNRRCAEDAGMGDVTSFVAMGGYAMFVWPAYAVAFAVLGGLVAQSWRRYRNSVTAIEQLQASRSRR